MVIRNALLAASRNPRLRTALESSATVRGAASRFVAGQDVRAAVDVARSQARLGMELSFDYLVADATTQAEAGQTVETWHNLLTTLDDAGLAHGADLTLRLSSLGLGVLDTSVVEVAVRRVLKQAEAVGATVTLGMEDATSVAATLDLAARVRADSPSLGLTLQSNLRRSADDAAALAVPDARVRVCKGAYREHQAISYVERGEVDHALVHIARVLLQGHAFVSIATADPGLLDVIGSMAVRNDRPKSSYEFSFLLGVRPDEQQRLAATGETVRVYIPFGPDWYAYVVRRIAERPAALPQLVTASDRSTT